MDRTKASPPEAVCAQRAAVFADAEAADLAQVYGPRLMQCPPEYPPLRDEFVSQDLSPDSPESVALDIAEAALEPDED